jgi:ABC-type transport system substrate-binding protein
MEGTQERMYQGHKRSLFRYALLVMILGGSSIIPVFLASHSVWLQSASADTTSPSSKSNSSVLTFESEFNATYYDPHVLYDPISARLTENVYESLLWFDKTNSTVAIPWLAQSYSLSSDGKVASFTLRKNITFADGDPLNSTAIYFSLNRLLIEDSSSPFGHGIEGSWQIQQLENKSLSSFFGGSQNYTQSWANAVLDQNLVQITGPLTFDLHILNPDASLPYLLATSITAIIDPQFVMVRDMRLWTEPNASYLLPYPTLNGSLQNQIIQYLHDEVATCNAGITPSGCGWTYLDLSTEGSTAGTGPYYIESNSNSFSDLVLKANPHYWGGPDQYTGGIKLIPFFQTVDVKYVPMDADRTRDLTQAASANHAMITEIDPSRFYDVANSTEWLDQNKLVSIIPNVTLYGPFTNYFTLFAPFASNVTNPASRTFFSFQPFSDIRLRLAFADAVDLNSVNRRYFDNLGQIAPNVIPPGFPPSGAYNTTILPRYSYNLNETKDLLLQAMMHPITSFTFANGTVAPKGVFNNTFGCSVLNSRGRCDNPVVQTIPLLYETPPLGLAFSAGVFGDIASNINQISQTYNMGLTVIAQPTDNGTLFFNEIGFGNVRGSESYMYSLGYGSDYPWVLDMLFPMFYYGFPSINLNLSPAGSSSYAVPDSWNLTRMNDLYLGAFNASQKSDVSAVLSDANQMEKLANDEVLYLWMFYPRVFYSLTANLQGFYFNPSTFGYAAGIDFASLSLKTSAPQSFLQNDQLIFVIGGVAVSGATLGTLYVRRFYSRRHSTKSEGPILMSPPERQISQSSGSAVLVPGAQIPPKEELETPGAVVQIAISLPNETYVGKEFQLKLDVINTGKKVATLHKLEDFFPSGLQWSSNAHNDNLSTKFNDALINNLENNTLELHGKLLNPSQIVSFTFALKGQDPGERIFSPKITYSDESGKLYEQKSSSARIVVKPALEFTFQDEKAEIVFDYLVTSFIQDYMNQKLSPENSGWRTLPDISKRTRLPLYTIYQRGGGIGPLMIELKSRGLLEERVFKGERGRGGEILRTRVAYSRDNIKEYVSQRARDGPRNANLGRDT